MTQFRSSCSGEVHSSQDISKNKFYFHLRKSVQITKCRFHAEHEGGETSEGLIWLKCRDTDSEFLVVLLCKFNGIHARVVIMRYI